MSVPYSNRGLFSDHWLRERLPQRDEYALTPLGLAKLALWLRALPDAEPEAAAWDARETLARVVAPCLALLGYDTGEWLSIPQTLWPHDADLLWRFAAPDSTLSTMDAPGQSQAIIGVVAWSADLDVRPVSGAGRGARAQAPALLFLRRLAQSQAEWGILTNGRRWRLYARGAEPLEAAYEVDLAALAASGAVDPLRAFWLFFAAQAQVASAEGELSFLRTAQRESREYAARIEDDLRARAFDAIQAACQALADALAAERGVSTTFLSREDLAGVYADALALLYRLLFVLYAESRDLLPAHEPAYAADYSLRELIAHLPARPDAPVDATEAGAVWPRLALLFRALSGEERVTTVPAFSGRLFDDTLHPLLARLTPEGRLVARMLILLGRTEQGRQIDYADLAVRQLGSIYEGLLEHQAIGVAVEEMALVKGPKDKAPLIVSRAAAGDRRILATYLSGTVYLANDKGKRHAAGTYYTPEPVVRYLVEETLGPLVAGKTAEQVLALRILDPAMGSAHFLVTTVDYLTRAALAAQESTQESARERDHTSAAHRASQPSPLDTDVLELKRHIAEQCVYGVDINEAAVELGKLSLWLATAAKDRPLTFLDLHLRAGNSLIGLVPGELEAAVEQAPTTSGKTGTKKPRKSRSAAQAAPTLPQMEAEPERIWNETAFTQAMFKVVGSATVVDMMPTDSLEAVRAKQRVTSEIERETRRYREAADLAVSLRLGARVAPAEYRAALATLLERGGIALGQATLGAALAQARQASARHAIFHWELEFPEIFRDGNGQPRGASAGFDAILGNPPCVSVTTLRAADPVAWAYYPQVFATTAQGKYDLYAAFVERGLQALKPRGRLAYILPNKWLTTDFGAPLRDLLAARRAVSALVDFGAYPVFPGVSNYTCLLFLGGESASVSVMRRTEPEGEIELPPLAQSHVWTRGRVDASTLGPDAWNITVGGAQGILDRWREWPTLKQAGAVFEGANPVFILTELAREGEVVTCEAPTLARAVQLEAGLLHPVLQGRDIQPYSFDGHGALLLSPYRLAEGRATLLPAAELADRYPLTWAYLSANAIAQAKTVCARSPAVPFSSASAGASVDAKTGMATAIRVT